MPSIGNVVAVELALTDPKYPFVGLSTARDCLVRLEKILPRGSGHYAEFLHVRGEQPDAVLEAADIEGLEDAKLLRRYEDGGLFEFVLSAFCPVRDLAERGAIPIEVVGENGRGRIVAEIPGDENPSAVIADFMEEHSSAELVSKGEKDRLSPVVTRDELQRTFGDRLTTRQREVIETAYEQGYYDPSVERSLQDLADEFDITASTVSQHLAATERKVVSLLFEERILDV